MVEISWPLERHFHFPLLTNHHIYLSPPSFTLSVSLCLSLSRCDALLLPLNCFPIAIFHICCRLHNAYDCYFVWLHLIQFDSISFELISFATRTHLAFSLVVSYLDSRTIALYMYAYVCICILHAQRDLIYLSLSLFPSCFVVRFRFRSTLILALPLPLRAFALRSFGFSHECLPCH